MTDWKLLLTIGVLVALMLVLIYRLLHKDPGVRRTRYGFFIERDRYDDQERRYVQANGEELPWPLLKPPPEKTLTAWGDQPTEEQKSDA